MLFLKRKLAFLIGVCLLATLLFFVSHNAAHSHKKHVTNQVFIHFASKCLANENFVKNNITRLMVKYAAHEKVEYSLPTGNHLGKNVLFISANDLVDHHDGLSKPILNFPEHDFDYKELGTLGLMLGKKGNENIALFKIKKPFNIVPLNEDGEEQLDHNKFKFAGIKCSVEKQGKHKILLSCQC